LLAAIPQERRLFSTTFLPGFPPLANCIFEEIFFIISKFATGALTFASLPPEPTLGKGESTLPCVSC